ncbi:MAG TPA: cbb3-type cytochrome oxidase assembly protein CcoS [Anaeromyxobacter sp.]
MSLGLLIGLSLALGVAAWLFFMWTVKSGQYDDPEGPKYRMLDDDEGEKPPRPEDGAPPPNRQTPPPR